MRQVNRRITIWTTIASLAVGMLLTYTCNHSARARNIAPFGPTTITGRDFPAPPSFAAATTSASPQFVDYQDKGSRFHYPTTWKPKEDKDYELHLVPSTAPANCNITFDIPDLPPHFPGMIRLGLIEHGWVDDQKKSLPSLHVDNSADYPIGGAKARLVQCSWKQDNAGYAGAGLLIMHSDRVYILAYDADAKSLAQTRDDFHKIGASLRWDK